METRITVALPGASPRTGMLTTDHATSSYGIPVVVVEGEAYGTAEVLWVNGSPSARREAARAGYPLREPKAPAPSAQGS
jgi:hypothetical protein